MGRQFKPGQLQTGSLYDFSSSFAITASYALNSDGSGFPFSGSAVITGSLLVIEGGITGSMKITNLDSGSYTQSFTNQSTWTLQHNLNSAYVIVQVYDLNYEQVIPNFIDLQDANTAVISFAGIPFSGTAVAVVGSPLAGNNGGGNTAVSASYATTASFASNVVTINTSSFATTGSNTFIGNQSITGSLIVTGSTQGNVTALTISSNTASLDLSQASFYTLQLVAGTNTFINPSNIRPGVTSTLLISTTGSATVSFPTSVKQPSGSAYTPTTTTGKDVLTFISYDASALYVANVKNLI